MLASVIRSGRSMLVGSVALVVLAAGLAVPTGVVHAATIRAFGIRYQADINGAIDIFGNTLLTCPASAATCAAAQNPPNGNTTNYTNNNFSMVNVDVDGATFPTVNSSNATVSMPANAAVRFAGLYWSATSASAARNTIKLRGPGDTAYTTVTASQLDLSGTTYQGFANVTSFVQTRRSGVYWGADVQANIGTNQYAGWALVVVWEDSSQPLRNLTVFDGFGVVANNTADRTITIPLSGFLAPPFGAVQTEVGVIAYEGDRGVGATGDAFQLNTTNLSNALNPANDTFNGSISTAGVSDGGRNPSYVNTLGFDADEFNAAGILPNSSTSATVTLTTGGETFFPGVITTAIDLYAPSFPEQTKTVTNLTRGTDPALPGDVLEYQLALINNGLDPADQSIISDTLPPNTTFVPGSLAVLTGANAGGKTDGATDDQAEYDSGTRTVQFRVGTGATAAAGGTLGPNAATTTRFRVTVDVAASGTTLNNSYRFDYRARTINRVFTYNSNAVSTPVAELADLRITKSASPDPIVAGEQVTYTVTVTNAGPRPAQGVVVTDTLPAGVTLVSATPSAGSCTATTCTIGSVAFPGSATVSYVVSASSDLAAGSLLANTASVSSTTGDPAPGDETTTITTPVVASADVRITKTANPSPVVAGNTITWTLTATNDGPSTARAVTITDVLPAGATLVSAAASAGSCAPGAPVNCAIGDLADGASATVTITATVVASATGSLVNTASVSSSTPDPTAGNNESTSSTTVNRQVALTVTKTALTNPIVPGHAAQWRIVVANAGPSDSAAVTVNDPAPAGVTWTAASLPGCTLGAAVSCPITSIPAGSSVTIVVTGDVAATVTDGSGLANTATATSGAITANGTSTTPVDAQVTLTTAKVASPDPVVAGTPLTYTLSATNDGPSAATNVVITDGAPTGITFTGQTAPGGTCAGSTAALVTCTFASLAPGATATVTITATVDPAVVGTAITNVATFDSDQTAPQDSTFVSSVGQSADVFVTKSALTSPVTAGSTAQWQIVYGNNGPSTAQGVTVTDTFPAGMTITALTGGSCTGIGTATLNCTQASVAVGAPVTVTVTVSTPATAAAGPASNTATITATTPTDPTASNNSGTATLDIDRSAAVSVTKSANGALVPGTPYRWTITVDNAGPSTAEGVVVTDTLAPGTTFDSAASSPECTAAGQSVTCTVASLATASPPAQATLTIGVLTSPTLTGDVANTATASATTPDPSAADNTATSLATVTPRADVSIAKVGPPSLTAGLPGTWTVTVTNAGPSDASAVQVADAAPTSVAWTSIGSDLAGETCTIATGVCSLPVLPAGASWTLTYTGAVSALASGSVVNVASVSSPTDTTPGNTATTTTPIVTEADLVVDKRPLSTPATAGTQASWLITVTNRGPSEAVNVALADTPSSGQTLASITPSAGTCDTAARTCDLGDIGPGDTVSITVVTIVDSAAGGTELTNTASVTSDTTDPDPDPPVVATLPVVGLADLNVSKSASSTDVIAGGRVQWTITVVNAGPSDAVAATINDSIPAGVSGVTATSTAGSCTVGAAVSCALGTLTPGTTAFVVVAGTVSASAPNGSTIANTVTTTSATTDPDATDNSAASVTPVATRADLRVTKTALSSPFVPGRPVSWTVTVLNAGPSDAQNVVLIDPATPGVTGITATPTGCIVVVNVTCRRPVLAAGASVTWTLTGTLDAAYSAATLDNTANASSDTADPDGTNNSSTASTSVVATADVSIAKRVVATPTAGGPISWELTVVNAGPSVATNVQASDIIPAGVTGVTATPPAGTNCTGTTTITCTTATLAVGTPVVITLAGTLAADTPPTALIANTATVTADTPDGNPANNTSTATTSIGTSADVTVAKVANGPFVAGQPASWTITVTNGGPSSARAVTVADTLPPTLLAPTLTPAVGTCAVSGATGSCALGDLTVGQTVTITVAGTIDAGHVGSITNQATVSSSSPDPDPADNAAAVTTAVGTSADVSITKSAAPATFVAGQPVVYTITVTNAGPSVARNVAVADPMPVGVTAESVSSTLGSCDTTVACALGDLPPGGSAIITVNARPSASFAHATDAINTATVTSPTADPDAADNSATATNEVRRVADVFVVKTAAPVAGPIWDAGEVGRYTLTVTNIGPSASGALTIDDPLPAAVTFSSFVSVDTGLTCGQAVGVVTCTAADVSAGRSLSVVVEVVLDAGATPGSVDNTVTVTQAGADDPDPLNNAASAAISIATSADLSVTKIPSAPTAVAGETVAWTIEVTNAGPSIARDVVVADTLPAGLTWTGVPGACTVDLAGTGISCDAGDVAAGVSVSYVVVATIAPGQAAGQVVNTADAGSSTPDPAPDNNIGYGPVEVVRVADVRVSKQALTDEVTAGAEATWEITVENLGPSTATDVVVTDDLPVALSFVAAGSDSRCVAVDQLVTCSLGTLAAGQTVVLDIVTLVADNADAGTITNNAQGSTTTPDSTPDNNGGGGPIDVVRSAALVMQKDPVGVFAAGGTGSWSIVVRNDGPSSSRDTVVTDTYPAGFTGVSVTSTGGACATSATDLLCNLGTLASGAQVTITVNGTVAAAATGSLTNTATVTSSTPNPNPAAATDSGTAVVVAAADLVITKTASTPIVAGQLATWTISVQNNGPAAAQAVQVSDPAPAGVGFVGATSSQGTCTATAAVVQCALGNVAPGPPVIIEVVADIAASASGTITNTAAVSSTTVDPDPSSNQVSTASVVQRISDLTLAKSTPTTSVRVGGTVVWTIVVTNNGPSVAEAVTITDTLPVELAPGAPLPAGCTASLTGRSIECIRPTLAVGETWTVLLPTRAVRTGRVTNSAAVASSGVDPTAAVASATVTVTGVALPATGIDIVRLVRAAGATTAFGTLLWLVGTRRRRKLIALLARR